MEQKQANQATSVLSNILENLRNAIAAPGIAAGVSAKGKRIEAFAGHADSRRETPVNRNSRFGIACVTKLLTAIIIQKLEAEGVLSAADPADQWLAPVGLDTGSEGRLKIAHLLTHTSGLQGPLLLGIPHRLYTIEKLQNELGSYKRLFSPGGVFSYENIGHVLVAEIVLRASGLPITDLFFQEIFNPLGIIPGNAVRDFKNASAYVAPHRLVEGSGAQVVAPSSFGAMWAGSLSDLTLTIGDLLTIGEAIVTPGGRFHHLLPTLRQRQVEVPETVSVQAREHLPQFFNLLCAEYRQGWFGYAGSPLGQTIGFRFNPESRLVTAVAMNAWLPIARDFLLDRLAGSVTHPEAGKNGRTLNIKIDDLTGSYRGGGNIIRMAEVKLGQGAIKVTLGPEGLSAPEFSLEISEDGALVPEKVGRNPALGFFREPDEGKVCLFVGSAALKREDNHAF